MHVRLVAEKIFLAEMWSAEYVFILESRVIAKYFLDECHRQVLACREGFTITVKVIEPWEFHVGFGGSNFYQNYSYVFQTKWEELFRDKRDLQEMDIASSGLVVLS